MNMRRDVKQIKLREDIDFDDNCSHEWSDVDEDELNDSANPNSHHDQT